VQDALVAYRRVVRQEPANAYAIGNLGATLGKLGHWAEALEFHEAAMKLAPNAVHAYNLAITLAELGRLDKAEDAFRTALGFEPGSTDLKMRLGMVLAQQEKHKDALEIVRSVIKEEPDNATALSLLSSVMILQGRVGVAVRVAQHLARRYPRQALSYTTLGWAYVKAGNPQSAVKAYEQGLLLEPANAELHAGRGVALSLLERHKEAMDCFNEAIRLDGTLIDANQELAQYLALSRRIVKSDV
jgi:tetratricopeptide (TPR) repeat protein